MVTRSPEGALVLVFGHPESCWACGPWSVTFPSCTTLPHGIFPCRGHGSPRYFYEVSLVDPVFRAYGPGLGRTARLLARPVAKVTSGLWPATYIYTLLTLGIFGFDSLPLSILYLFLGIFGLQRVNSLKVRAVNRTIGRIPLSNGRIQRPYLMEVTVPVREELLLATLAGRY